ncbi:hypothetical protein SNE40_022873 [Patella caerulea]|uniref:Uncharacterized protein n=1 Tax=Patella caerulea TaxID=87958 RepID=A0AAN8FXG4_PATCE
MKFALLLLVVLPLAFANPEKRFFLDGLEKLSNILNLNEIKTAVQTIANKAGSDATEGACETHCKEAIQATLITEACPFVCKS